MRLGPGGLAVFFLLLCSTQAAVAAVSIQYTVVPLGGNVYKYVYSVTNSGASPTVQLFDILFDTSLYDQSSLVHVTPAPLNTQWTEDILHAVPPALPASYTVFRLTGGIAAGETVSGFAVQFTWTGTGTPGAQPFQIFDLSYNLLQSGASTAAPQTVPTASTLSLALLGISLSAAAAYQARLRAAEAIRSRSPESW